MGFRVEASHNPAEWDQFVAAQSPGHFMQSYAWGQFQGQLGWEPRYCVLEEGNHVAAAVLMLARKVPGTGANIFHVPRGPAVEPTDAPITERLFKEMAAYVKNQNGVFLRCDPYWTESESRAHLIPQLKRVPRDWSYWNGPRFVLWLDLTGDEETVLMRMTSKTRNDIRRGYRNDVVFEVGTEDDLPHFYHLMVQTGQEKGIAFHGLEYYRKLYRVVNESARVRLFFGRHDGEVITTGISVAYGTKAWLLYAASSPAHYKLRANRTQQWEMIKWAHGEGCDRYDFRGTATNDPPREDDPGYGVYMFKKSFGPEFVRLTGYHDLVNRRFLYRGFRMAEDLVLPAAYRVRTWLQER